MCFWFFHKWSKWSDVEYRKTERLNPITNEYLTIKLHLIQEKICKNCNQKKFRSILVHSVYY